MKSFYSSCKISQFCGRVDARIFPFSALMGLSAAFCMEKMNSCSVDFREKPALPLLIPVLPEILSRYLEKRPAMDDDTQSCTHHLHSTHREALANQVLSSPDVSLAPVPRNNTAVEELEEENICSLSGVGILV